MWLRKTVLWQVLAWVVLSSLVSRLAIAVPRQDAALISAVVATYNHDRLNLRAISRDLMEGRSRYDRNFIERQFLKVKGPLPAVQFSPKKDDRMILLQSGEQTFRLKVNDPVSGDFELNGKALHVSPFEPLSVVWRDVQRAMASDHEISWMDFAVPSAHAAVIAIVLCVLALVALIGLLLRESYLGWRGLQTLEDEASKQLGPCEVRKKQLRQALENGAQVSDLTIQEQTMSMFSQQLNILKAQLPECAKQENCVPEMKALEECLKTSISIVEQLTGRNSGAMTVTPEKGPGGPSGNSSLRSGNPAKSLR